MLLHRFADKPVIPALQELDKICFGIFISVDKDFAVLIDQNVNTISFTGTVWFDEQLALFLQQGDSVFVLHMFAVKAGEKTMILNHVTCGNSDVLLQNFCRRNLVIEQKVEWFIDVPRTVPIKLREVFALVVVIKIIKHPLICKKSAADVCSDLLPERTFKIIFSKDNPSPIKDE